MKNKKKFILIVFAILPAVLLGLSACGDSPLNPAPPVQPPEQPPVNPPGGEQPTALELVKVTISGIGTGHMSASAVAHSPTLRTSFDLTPLVSSSNTALALDGDGEFYGDYVKVPASASLNITNNITLEAWILPEDAAQNGPILEYNGDSGLGVHFWRYPDPNDLFIHFKESGGPGHAITADAALTIGKWQHVAAVYDKATGIGTLYVNGAQVAQTNLGSFSLKTSGDLYIGHRFDTGFFYDGVIDEVRIWNTARTPAQLKNNMNKQIDSTTAGLAAYYRLNESSGDIAHDATANNNDGTLKRDPQFGAPGPFFEGTAVNGDGSIQLKSVSNGSFTYGERGNGGVRYVYATFKVRNAQADSTAYTTSRTNLTFLAVDTDETIGVTPVSILRLFGGTSITGEAATNIAEAMKPTGQVGLNTSLEIVSSGPDVLQVFTEDEVTSALFPHPEIVNTVFPYGFVTRNATSTGTRTLAANPAEGEYEGLVTFAYKIPLQATADEDPFEVSIMVLPVDDSETRITQSVEEQTPEGQAAFEARAAALGAATVTLLTGGSYTGSITSRTIDRVRTAGTDVNPITFLFDPPVVPAPNTGTLSVSDNELTADGASHATVTVQLYNGYGSTIKTGGFDVSLEVTGITENTPGATVSALADNGDGTYTATLTAPTNNGTSFIKAKLNDTIILDSLNITYSGGNHIPEAHDIHITSPEDTRKKIILSGTDADGDPLTYHLVRMYRATSTHGSHFDDPDGNVIVDFSSDSLDTVLDDPTLYFVPKKDQYFNPFVTLYYTVSDGKSTTNEIALTITVTQVNDAPRPTMMGKVYLYEDEPYHFRMSGYDPELDRFRVLIVISPITRGLLFQRTVTGDYYIGPSQPVLLGTSDVASRWPMRFEPVPNDYNTTYYNSFDYRLQEIYTGVLGETARITFIVLPVNDAPEISIDGFGSAQNHNLSTTVINGGTYSLPALDVTDVDLPYYNGTDPFLFDVTIETSGDGKISLDTKVYDWVVSFAIAPDETSISFQMKYDISDQTLPGTNLKNLLNTLRYKPQSTGTETLTITIDDQGNFGSCTAGEPSSIDGGGLPSPPPPPCAKQAVTTITVNSVAGTPPGGETVMALTEGS